MCCQFTDDEVELVDNSFRVVIRSSQNVTEVANMALSEGVEDVPPVKTLTGHEIRPVHLLFDPECVEQDAMVADSKALAERPCFSAI